MNRRTRRPTVVGLTTLVCGLSGPVAGADLTLPPIIADHMVFQQGQPVHIWGWSERDETIRVEFAGQTQTTRARDSGQWSVNFEPMRASHAPRTMTVHGERDTLRINDILIGEVWVCSGQSNMAWTMKGTEHGATFIAGANDPRVRMFIVPRTAEHTPQERGTGTWHVASPETVADFSAVGYHFGLELLEHLDTPIGLLHTSWGGSTAEAWTTRSTLEELEAVASVLEAYDAVHEAIGLDATQFAGVGADDATWETVELPALVEDLGHDVDGIIWFRRQVDIPRAWTGRDLVLRLGAIDDNDVTYFNGARIGGVNNWQTPRVYTIPAELVTSSTATLAVRVEDTGGAGGFSGAADDLSLRPADTPAEAIHGLAGPWRMHILTNQPSMPVQHRPANLYNAMIHPWRHYQVRGAVWYQGESNAYSPRGEEYFTLFPAMIRDWRFAFGQPDLPFYYVQLPNFTNNEANTVWRYPTLRQAQLETMRTLPHTGMAVTLDLGDANDIHPRNKRDVGERLAAWALADTYGVTGIVKSGPIFQRAESLESDGQVQLTFDTYGSTLAIHEDDGYLTGFEIAGPNGVFLQAQAIIENGRVLVWSTMVSEPHAVRYAWQNNAVDANLLNARGWPASPFVVTIEE